ncbi:AI-2E family transporter [Nevskia soli]|uniref:AI-2E family transporter n=1 Tax=Nevskia soli TaxID=418856 RepID=UPI0004A767BF|nr:AI-2E family transporter [Nevskia soli]
MIPSRFEHLIRLTLLLALLYAGWSVLEPFVAAILFALAIAVTTWPAYSWLLRGLGGHRSLAGTVACIIVAVAVMVPSLLLVLSLGDAATWLARLIQEWQTAGLGEPPRWLTAVPLVGPTIGEWLRDLSSSGDRMTELLSSLEEPVRRAALATGRALGRGVGQVLLAAVLLFFLYRDGDRLALRLRSLAHRLGGDDALALLDTAQRTIAGVMFSVVGTALAQAMVAYAGFAIAGVPNPALLSAATFVLSMAPIGPPLIWGGAALWLLRQGDSGWAVFMGLYGFFGISSVDNVIKPFLISRSSHLPFVLTFMGVVGGVLAFGVAGIFIGPTALALLINLAEQRFFGQAAVESGNGR